MKDTKWVCVYKTDATNVEEAEKEIYASSYKQLPKKIINKAIQIMAGVIAGIGVGLSAIGSGVSFTQAARAKREQKKS